MSDRILEDLKVVDLTWVVAGPRVSRALADYGATVVHVESSRRIETARVAGPFQDGVFGPEHSLMYGNGNVGKLGVTLDLAREEARGVMRDLLRWGDVFIESFTPGVVQRWGLSYDDVQALNPSIIMVSTCLMGQDGPFASYAGYGTAGAGMSGFQNLAGWPGRPPIGPFGPYTDYVGPRFALPLLLAALDHRRRTGEGCYIDHSQSESGQFFLAPEFADYFVTGRSLEYSGKPGRGDGASRRVPVPHPPASSAWHRRWGVTRSSCCAKSSSTRNRTSRSSYCRALLSRAPREQS